MLSTIPQRLPHALDSQARFLICQVRTKEGEAPGMDLAMLIDEAQHKTGSTFSIQ